MDGIDIVLRVIGAFYALAGFFAARAALTSNLIDQAIAAISMKKTERIETHRTIWLLSLSVLFFAGGACLILLLEPAAWLFGIATLVQILFFLVLGPYYFDVADPPPPEARQRSINAFVVFGACTLLILWAAYMGRLTKLTDAPLLLWGPVAAAIALHIGYILRHTLAPPKRKPGFAAFDSGDDESDIPVDSKLSGADIAGSRRIKVMADYGCYPLWAMDEGAIGPFSPQHLGVSMELENDLWSWAAEFDMSFNMDDPAKSSWSDERYRQHVEEGLALARRIKSELPDREVFALDTEGKLIEIDTGSAAGAMPSASDR
ncbi:hypothetical protein [Hyphomicrobium sp. CS1BSMeth3]|uniref:hypothetical protein n=1 Tax=Hyphomicrobium sp. CS1BSMeth3 TaxID=1892844 RepID=UPI000931AC69|nr:hypothetical protein [Hyphomicrobium sp. CS1BSMeth3]